ncbi:hypothetical protein Vadar_027643 [Vaccinium darrowii]|uniref:Uncharacterized protein n=1 Tax=Vaccinium darrowii TaxID=229202 RepID=A0ACB7Y9I1_9ERIC|nr:hypothetical protein Vadar_027643 [Vaccinium darrowii]
MVSFDTPLQKIRELENSTKKRKWEEEAVGGELLEKPLLLIDNNYNRPKAKSPKSMLDMELLPLETPLPLEWQRCLDIKSGQIHYYNVRTQTRTSKDPRTTTSDPDPPAPPPTPPLPTHMSLDLELNLPCGSTTTTTTTKTLYPYAGTGDPFAVTSKDKDNDYSGGGGGIRIRQCPSWLAFEGDEREMITAACKKCHMLVMMCKSSPACPNCKFLHPPDQSYPNDLFNKSGLSLLC